jgi:hypothetical protein
MRPHRRGHPGLQRPQWNLLRTDAETRIWRQNRVRATLWPRDRSDARSESKQLAYGACLVTVGDGGRA